MIPKILTALVLALFAVCPSNQVWRDPRTCPFMLDLGQIPMDPETNQPALLGWVLAEVGRTVIVDANYCDPENDAVALAVTDPARHVLAVDPNADPASGKTHYSVTTIVRAGADYVTITATDAPTDGRLPKVRRGTFVIQGLPVNRPPILGCGALRK